MAHQENHLVYSEDNVQRYQALLGSLDGSLAKKDPKAFWKDRSRAEHWSSAMDTLKSSITTFRDHLSSLIGKLKRKNLSHYRRPKECTEDQQGHMIQAWDGLGSLLLHWLIALGAMIARLVLAAIAIIVTPFYAAFGLIHQAATKKKAYGLHSSEGQSWFLNHFILTLPRAWAGHKKVDTQKTLQKHKGKAIAFFALFPISYLITALALPFVGHASFLKKTSPLKKPGRIALVIGKAFKALVAPLQLLAHLLNAIFQTLLYGAQLVLRNPTYLLAPITLAMTALTIIQITQFYHLSHLALNPLALCYRAIAPHVHFSQMMMVNVILLVTMISLWALLARFDKVQHLQCIL